MVGIEEDIDRFRQGLLFGYCLDILLYGILTVQTYLYYIAFPKDKSITKAIVAFIYIVGTIQTVLAIHDFYLFFCVPKSYYRVMAALTYNFTWVTIPLSSTLVATVAQLFYAHRIYILSKKKVVTGIIIALALAQLGFGIFSAVVFRMPTVIPMLPVIAGGAVGTCCDLVIALYMFYFLATQMKRSSRTTQVALTRIKRLLLETGLLTAALAIAYPLFVPFADYNTFAIPGLSLGKVYSNSILVLLNNRFTIEGGRNEPDLEFEINSYHLSDIPRRETQ